MINFNIDRLLFNEPSSDEFKNINNCLKERIILDKDILNLYSCFVKSLDFKSGFKSMIFCKLDSRILLKYIPHNFKKNRFLLFRKKIMEYCRRDKMKLETFVKWLDIDLWPFPILRIVSLFHKQDLIVLSKFIRRIEYFTNYKDTNRFYSPKRIKELLTPKMAYLSGCILGDGGFSSLTYWSIVDGSNKEDRIIYSIKYLNNLRDLMIRLFKVDYIKIPKRRDNRIELIIIGKTFSRFINYFFCLPFGKKKGKIKKPEIFKNKLEAYFWRGIFDTDGYCDNKSGDLSISSSDKEFLIECESYLNKKNIKTNRIRFGKSKSYSFKVKGASYKDFVFLIGFSHPRKKLNLLNHLMGGNRRLKYFGIKEDNLYNKFVDLRKIKCLYAHGLNREFKNLRLKIGLYQKDLAKLLYVKLERIHAWETKTDIPFLKFYKLWRINDRGYNQLFSFLVKKDILWSINGRKGHKIRIPLKINKSLIDIAKNVRPYKGELRVLKGGRTKKELEKLFMSIEKCFLVDVKQKRKGVFCILSNTCARFFNNFFDYRPYWDRILEKDITRLDKRLNSIWY